MCSDDVWRLEWWNVNEFHSIKIPYRPSGILYVQETWDREPVTPEGHFLLNGVFYYKADGDLRPKAWRDRWRSPITMPRKAARIFLRVTDVRVERLQDITEEQAVKEGVYRSREDYGIAIYAFSDIWDRIIKPTERALYGWNANPYVWVIEFERISKEEAENEQWL